MDESHVILAPNVDNVYKLPYLYYKQNFHQLVFRKLGIKKSLQKTKWASFANMLNKIKKTVVVNLVVKYGYGDAYISLVEALKHSAYKLGRNVEFNWIDVRNISEKELL